MVATNGTTPQTKKGFRIPDQTAHITFSGTDYDGAEIWVKLNVMWAVWSGMRKPFLALGVVPLSMTT